MSQTGHSEKRLISWSEIGRRFFDLHRSGVYNDNKDLEQKNMVNPEDTRKGKSSYVNENRVEEFDMDEALTYCFQFVRASAKT